MMRKISSLKYSKMISIDSEASIDDAINLMNKQEVNLLLVTEAGKGIGVLTSGAVFSQFYLHAGVHYPIIRFHGANELEDLNAQKLEIYKDRLNDFKKVKVSEVYSPRVRSVKLSQDVCDAVHMMKSLNLRRLVVADAEGNPIGVIDRQQVLHAAFNP